MKGEVGEGVLGKDHPELMRCDVGPSLQLRGHQHGAKARGEIRQGHPERCDAAGLGDRRVMPHALRVAVNATRLQHGSCWLKPLAPLKPAAATARSWLYRGTEVEEDCANRNEPHRQGRDSIKVESEDNDIDC